MKEKTFDDVGWLDVYGYYGYMALTYIVMHIRAVLRARKLLPSCRLKLKLNSMVWVRERTIPTERPPLVGEVIANLCG
jgi:hypothetical protein